MTIPANILHHCLRGDSSIVEGTLRQVETCFGF